MPKLKNNEPRPKCTGSYKKKACNPGGGYSHIVAIRVYAAGEGTVFKPFCLVKVMVFKPFGLVWSLVIIENCLVLRVLFKVIPLQKICSIDFFQTLPIHCLSRGSPKDVIKKRGAHARPCLRAIANQTYHP